jgi:hypothetical protein
VLAESVVERFGDEIGESGTVGPADSPAAPLRGRPINLQNDQLWCVHQAPVLPGTSATSLAPSTNHPQAGADLFAPVAVLRVSRPVPPPALRILQQFEGTVSAVTGEDFVAVLRDRTDPNRPEEEATFSLDEAGPDDLQLIEPGAVFYLTIAYENRPYRRRTSEIRFRRMPRWSKADLGRIAGDAAELHRLFGGAS